MRTKELFNERWKFHRGDIEVYRAKDKGPLYVQAKTERYRKVTYADRIKAEEACKGGNRAYKNRSEHRNTARDIKHLIMRLECEYAFSLRAHIKAVEYLCHRHGEERHSHSLTSKVGISPAAPALAADEEGYCNKCGNH